MTVLHYLDDSSDGYRAGACNIGPAEIARRRRAGFLGVGVTAVLMIALIAVGAPPLVRLAIAVPLAVGVLGFLQARSRFCVAYGMGGLRNFGALGAESRISDTADRKADQRRAMTMALSSGGLAIAIAAIFATLPLWSVARWRRFRRAPSRGSDLERRPAAPSGGPSRGPIPGARTGSGRPRS